MEKQMVKHQEETEKLLELLKAVHKRQQEANIKCTAMEKQLQEVQEQFTEKVDLLSGLAHTQ